MPDVTVITPVHNRPEHLEEAVQSIQLQSYRNWEHIIVNDGSTNPLTAGILKKISHLPNIHIYHTENKGVGHARNFAISRSSGRFILTLDDDDKWHTDFIKEAVDVFEKDPQTGVVTAYIREFGSRNRVVPVTGGDVTNFLMHNSSAHAMYRKECWQSAGGYDENKFIQAYADWDLWLRITGAGYRVTALPSPYFFYRIHEKSSMLKDSEQLHLELFRYLVEKNKEIYAKHVVDLACIAEKKIIDVRKTLAGQSAFNKVRKIISFFKR